MDPVVLVVDDDPGIRELLQYNLSRAGLRVLSASSGRDGLTNMETGSIDLVILDLMLPDLDGIELCRRFRRRSRAPVMMLTARYNEADRVRALEAGADDYVTKPFSPKELLARARAHLRRWSWRGPEQDAQVQEVSVGQLTLDLGAHRVYYRGQELHVTPMEYQILSVLCKAPGRVFPRERLLALATGQEVIGSARTVDVHIHSLRLKLEEDPTCPRFLETVRGAGYCIGRGL